MKPGLSLAQLSLLAGLTMFQPLGGLANGQENLDVDPSIVESVTELHETFVNRFPQRRSTTIECLDAGRWIGQQFRELGYRDVALRPFELQRGGVSHWPCNVVCEKPGSRFPDEIIVICAHYDSTNSRDPEGLAPGADDNASGTAAMLSVAKLCREKTFERTVWFIAFAGEEQGLIGSRELSEDVADLDREIVLLLNLDMVGHDFKDEGKIVVEEDLGNRVAENDAESKRWADLLDEQARSVGFITVRDGISRSDYMPFEALGIPCIGLYDGAADTDFYHSEKDNLEVVSHTYITAVVEATNSFLEEAMQRISESD